MKVYKKAAQILLIITIITAGILNITLPVVNGAEENTTNTINVPEENTTENQTTDQKTDTKKVTKKKKYAKQKGYVRALTTIVLRKTASNRSAWVATLKAGQQVYIQKTLKGWYKVKSLKGKTGYVKKKNIGTKSNKKYKLLTTYTTYSVGSPSNRNYNMRRAGNLINKAKVKKGKTFNWRYVVGACGGRQGYKLANCIIAGKVVPGYGGGVCQVATTLYGCSKKLKMKTIERHNHSARVSYLNKDRYEAAISYGHKNLRFKNTTRKNIKFDVYVTRGRVIVAAYQIL